MKHLLRTLTLLSLAFVFADSPSFADWKGGVAKANITPHEWMPMSGYGSRNNKHAVSKLTDLWAKAIVMEDDRGHQAVLVTLDLIGIDRGTSMQVCNRIQKNHNLKRAQIALSTSHTHTGPVVAATLKPMHYLLLDDANQKLVDQYAVFLEDQIVEVVDAAFENLGTAEFTWGSGTATFATNRRNNKEADVPKLREAGELKGPRDHDVPVLLMKKSGKVSAVVFGYACHSTTLSSMEWSGDYGGFAQIELEKEFPGAVALFWAGCGGDQNPLPRRTVELAKGYGHRLANAVVKATKTSMHKVEGNLKTRYEEVDLALAKLPSKEELVEQSKSSNHYIVSRAQMHLDNLAAGQEMSQTYPYPVELWTLGNDVTWVFQGGEVVIDYAIRIKGELGNKEMEDVNVWCAGYSNDVMAYIPSLRVLLEGGYEGASSMVYYGQPTVWSPKVEETIMDVVRRLNK